MSTKEDLHTFLRTRRSIRRFKPDPVPESVMESIIRTAAFAPSAHNSQPWRFVVITETAVKTRLGKALTTKMRADMLAKGTGAEEIDQRAARSLRRMDEAPVVVVLCRAKNAVRNESYEEVTMGIQSTSLAGLQLLLAAHAEGLGGNWICWALYAQEATRSALHLPEDWEPQAIYFLGYPNESPEPRTLPPTPEIVKMFTDPGLKGS